MLTNLLKTLNQSRYNISSGAYFQRTLNSTYEHHEKYLEIKYQASLKRKLPCDTLDSDFPLHKKDFKKVVGPPKYLVKNMRNQGIEILCYRLNFGRYKSDAEFHFYNDCLFFYCHTFTAISESKRNEIIAVVGQKYLDNNALNPDLDIITDGNALLSIESKFNLKMCYFSARHQPILDEFSQQIREQKSENKRLNHGQQLVYPGF